MWAETKGATKIRLGVRTNNKKAIKFYKCVGFEVAHYEMEKLIKWKVKKSDHSRSYFFKSCWNFSFACSSEKLFASFKNAKSSDFLPEDIISLTKENPL